jgi:glucokinase
MAEYAIGLDLGGTNMRAAAIDRSGRVLDKVSGSSQLPGGRDALFDEMATAIETLRERQGREGLSGIGVAVPGFILLKEGIVKNSNNIPALEDYPLRDDLEKRLGAKVVLENDANAAALGEKWMGTGRDVDDLILLTLGTGVGGGIICHGKVLHGTLGMAGELGHITVVPNGNPCGCGNHGCLEKHASATAIVAMAKLMGLGDNVTSEDVYNMAMKGNHRAHEIFVSFGRYLGIALATLINAFNFPLYLLGGGVLGAWNLFAPPMIDEIKCRSYTFRATNTRVEKAGLGNQSGLYGAAYLPWAGPEEY